MDWTKTFFCLTIVFLAITLLMALVCGMYAMDNKEWETYKDIMYATSVFAGLFVVSASTTAIFRILRSSTMPVRPMRQF